jgi:transposase
MSKKNSAYWLSDAEWAAIEPHLQRGRGGAHRVDDCRVISGIVHMLRSGGRWREEAFGNRYRDPGSDSGSDEGSR